MFWVLLVVPFLLALTPLPWKVSLPLWPVLLVGLGFYSWLTEPPNYDMPGLGLVFYGFLALVAVGTWCAGRAVREMWRRTVV